MSNENPYSTPATYAPNHQGPMPGGGSGAYVRQVKPLCICMIIQGALEILVGIGYIVMAFAMPAMILNQQGVVGPAGGPPGPVQAEQLEFVKMILWLTCGGGGGIAISAGILRVVAGVRGLFFRSHSLGIVSHIFGMLNLMTCYCIPTSFGLCIWGCIVYFNFDVKQAFKLGKSGHTTAEIEAQFSGR